MQQKEEASGLVLENRVSWSTYNTLRKAEGLPMSRKQPAENGANGESSSKKDMEIVPQLCKLINKNYYQKHKHGLLINK